MQHLTIFAAWFGLQRLGTFRERNMQVSVQRQTSAVTTSTVCTSALGLQSFFGPLNSWNLFEEKETLGRTSPSMIDVLSLNFPSSLAPCHCGG